MEYCHIFELIFIVTGTIGFITSVILSLWRKGDKTEGIDGKISEQRSFKAGFPISLLLCSIVLILLGEGTVYKLYFKTDRCGNNVIEVSLTNLDGEYFYLTTPHDKDQELPLEKNGKSGEYEKGYMYIGYLRIKNNKIVEANRDFIVRVENKENKIKVESTNVNWKVTHMFTDSTIDAVAYMLSTTSQKRLPSNTAIFVGSRKDQNNEISGHMHYMMKDPNSWLLANKTLVPMKPNTDREKNNPFIDCVNIMKWVKKQYPEKRGLACEPLEISK